MLLSKLEFGSFFSYCPRGESELIRRSQTWRDLIKYNKVIPNTTITASQYLAEMLFKHLTETPTPSLHRIFDPSTILVPVPKSSLQLRNSLWVPERIANALVEQGLGRQVAPILKRISSIPKAAFCSPGQRPLASVNYESLRVIRLLEVPEKILVVDDVITRGATILGSASKILDVYSGVEISAFAMLRTMSYPDEFERILDPCVGEIELHNDGTTVRRP
jgi:predicted amidophosphoribosyltransferase